MVLLNTDTSPAFHLGQASPRQLIITLTPEVTQSVRSTAEPKMNNPQRINA